eukprot:2315586-Amphidinium_carterae.1
MRQGTSRPRTPLGNPSCKRLSQGHSPNTVVWLWMHAERKSCNWLSKGVNKNYNFAPVGIESETGFVILVTLRALLQLIAVCTSSKQLVEFWSVGITGLVGTEEVRGATKGQAEHPPTFGPTAGEYQDNQLGSVEGVLLRPQALRNECGASTSTQRREDGLLQVRICEP